MCKTNNQNNNKDSEYKLRPKWLLIHWPSQPLCTFESTISIIQPKGSRSFCCPMEGGRLLQPMQAVHHSDCNDKYCCKPDALHIAHKTTVCQPLRDNKVSCPQWNAGYCVDVTGIRPDRSKGGRYKLAHSTVNGDIVTHPAVFASHVTTHSSSGKCHWSLIWIPVLRPHLTSPHLVPNLSSLEKALSDVWLLL